MTEPLATLGDYQSRYGSSDLDNETIEALLGDASSIIRQACGGRTISKKVDDVVTLQGNGKCELLLPEWPIISISYVKIEGEVVDVADYRFRAAGTLLRRLSLWPYGCDIEVKYTHGYDPVESWIIQLACSMVQRVVGPASGGGIVQSEQLGDHQVTYQTPGVNVVALGAALYLTDSEQSRLESMGGYTIA